MFCEREKVPVTNHLYCHMERQLGRENVVELGKSEHLVKKTVELENH